MLERKLPLDIFIVDNRSMREPIEPLEFKVDRTLMLTNPAGTITDDSWRVIGEAVNSNGLVKVLVDGEEDLLTIVAVLMAPENSLVIYGQPNEGIVVIRVNGESKNRMREIINRMECKPES
ncbi:MAG: GTP-dependent dephospho-CoA kinase family protein [Candidatus Bathyarchaeia archaeon]